MGQRTLSLALVFRALGLDSEAYDRLRDDDNPFVEGLFLIVLIGVLAALLSLIGQVVAWAGTPSMSAVKELIWQTLPTMSWWSQVAGDSEFMAQFKQLYDLGWQIFPRLFGAPDPTAAALNILLWPLGMLLSWLVYGTLAHIFARLLGGVGRYGQTLGVLALSYAPLLVHGLGFVPYFTVGAALNTWQLICRYKAIRSAGQLSWGRAFWATVLPFVVYLIFWAAVGGVVALGIAAAIAAQGGR
ncbi:MAG: Yip1 family protein [Anaerolineae bacterium]